MDTIIDCKDVPEIGTDKTDKSSSCILIVDDLPVNILIASTLIETFGYSFDVATNGQEAVDCIKSRKYAGVVMDIRMPIMNGLDAARAVRQFEQKTGRSRIGIMAVTAQALAGDREKCLAAGMDEYISKPFSPNELKEKLQTLTGIQ